MKTYKIYLDSCCISRPYDNQTQNRIKSETAANLNFTSESKIHIHGYRNTLELETIIMTDEQILELGFKALIDKLGPDGMVRFIHHFRAGTGDYTKERQQWVGTSDVETLAKQIQQAENDSECAAKILKTITQ